jgi:iron complex transport system substrate-binding protein
MGSVGSTNPEKVVFTDSTGTEIVLPHQAFRIISDNGDASEMLMAIGASDMIVGVPSSDLKNRILAPNLKNAKNMGTWLYPDIETILELKPDVLIEYSTAKPKNMDKILAANVTIVFIDSYRIDSLNDDAYALGFITGHKKEAEEYIEFNKKYLDLINKRIQNISPDDSPRVYVEAYTDNSAMTERSAGGRILKLLHAPNLFGNASSDWVAVNPEWVIEQNPDIILKIASDPVSSGKSLESVHDAIKNRLGYSNVTAVKEGKIFVINGDLASSPRGIIGLLYCAKALYPEKFSDINPDNALIEYSTRFVKGSENIEKFYPPFFGNEFRK